MLAQPAVPQPLGVGQPLGTPPPPYHAQAGPLEEPQPEMALPPAVPLMADPLLVVLRQEEPAEQVNKFLYLSLVVFHPYSVLHFSLPYVV